MTLDLEKIFLHIMLGLRHKILTAEQFYWTSSTILCELICQSFALENSARNV